MFLEVRQWQRYCSGSYTECGPTHSSSVGSAIPVKERMKISPHLYGIYECLPRSSVKAQLYNIERAALNPSNTFTVEFADSLTVRSVVALLMLPPVCTSVDANIRRIFESTLSVGCFFLSMRYFSVLWLTWDTPMMAGCLGGGCLLQISERCKTWTNYFCIILYHYWK